MATSDSAVPPQPHGECVVCGQKTATRCSSCSSHGTDWMYFCSTEHQKLVWSIHKRFSGTHSNPFEWPLLSKKEVEKMYLDCETPYKSRFGEEMCCLLDVWIPPSDNPVSTRERKTRFLALLCNNIQDSEVNRALYPLNVHLLVLVRCEAGQLESNGPKSRRIPGTTLSSISADDEKELNPINAAITYQEETVDGLALQKDPTWEPWWSTYQLKYMNYIAIQHAFDNHFFSPPYVCSVEIGHYLDHSAQELKSYCTNVITQTHPEIGRVLALRARSTKEVTNIS